MPTMNARKRKLRNNPNVQRYGWGYRVTGTDGTPYLVEDEYSRGWAVYREAGHVLVQAGYPDAVEATEATLQRP